MNKNQSELENVRIYRADASPRGIRKIPISHSKEKMEARKNIRETFDAYQERTKNNPPKKIKDLDVKVVSFHIKAGPPVGAIKNPRTGIWIEREPLDYSKVEMTNGDKIIYGIDEIGSILGLYGKDSEIYNAMAEGKVVSPMVEESMKKNQEEGNEEIAKREESLLARCLKREQEKGLDV